MSARPPLCPDAVALLACPVCGRPLEATADDAALRCGAGHAFDRARQGHVTLLPPGHRAPSGDSAAMVADRVAFLEAGHYAGVTAAVAEAVAVDGVPASLLDLGGGTGHHLGGVLDRIPGAVGVVLDSSAYAARRAARAHPRAVAVVADTWARLPVRDGVVDRVLIVFAPRNGPEIARVLRPEGRLVVVTPTGEHLRELVGPLGLLRVDPDKAARLAATLEPDLEPVRTVVHRRELALPRSTAATLVGMGPHARHTSAEAVEAGLAGLAEPVVVTVSVDVTTYRRRPATDT
ncbi:putative RNA methyltransferase [Blastococcus tunisiensis]|uniref:23S rRNA m(1)G-748 methyltransferase n=1 Tax=Blastococcus tunisiensis TaxID=1798228 RepID=A0A1I2LLM8_9ACTN|nr:methyltransferase domain-containing protein [Blastococcus sp. DSM 46838]SFF80422.1 23S rRNA m(1)G-748 methyltransferase [Blastococcus sp. DSM 46838]